jgi:hypothetical protein
LAGDLRSSALLGALAKEARSASLVAVLVVMRSSSSA